MTDGIDIESLGNGRFAIGGELSFETAEIALEEGERLFGPFQSLDLDCGQIRKGDSAGLAVMIEWISRAKHEEKTIRLRHLPTQFRALAGISEVENLLPMADDSAAQ